MLAHAQLFLYPARMFFLSALIPDRKWENFSYPWFAKYHEGGDGGGTQFYLVDVSHRVGVRLSHFSDEKNLKRKFLRDEKVKSLDCPLDCVLFYTLLYCCTKTCGYGVRSRNLSVFVFWKTLGLMYFKLFFHSFLSALFLRINFL